MRHRLPLVVLAAAGVLLAGQAVAPGAATSVIRMPSDAQCLKGSTVRLVFSPPDGQTIASLSVRVGNSEALQLAQLSGAGSMVVKVPRPGVRVNATGSTSGGRFLTVRRAYERCVPNGRPAPTATPEPLGGGGGGG